MKPKKNLGQHFLTAPATARKIAEAVPAHGDSGNVVEIGPGRGALSVHLIERFCNLHFIEFDKDVVATLEKKLREKLSEKENVDKENVEKKYIIHNVNALEFDFEKIEPPMHVVGNLPYNVGAHIIKKVLMQSPRVSSVTFMVQKEVAQRIVAAPHTKENGFLSIFCNFFGRAKLLFTVPPGSFFPRPAVDSAVFQIVVDGDVEQKLSRDKWEDFFNFMSAGFLMRRKQLAKVMSLKFDKSKEFYESILKDININAQSRPEDLDVDKWLDFYKRAKS